MSEKIEHEGIVERVEGNRLWVRIMQQAACSSCQVASQCNASEVKIKHVSAWAKPGKNYAVGDAVTIYTDMRTGYKAVALAFGLPLLMMLVTLFIVRQTTGNDGWAALGAVLSLIPSYAVIALARKKINQSLQFYAY